MTLTEHPFLHWEESQQSHQLPWINHAGQSLPKRVIVADDSMKADVAYRLACEGCAFLWRGDFQNAKNLLQALARRIEKSGATPKKFEHAAQAYYQHRQKQAQKARILNLLLIPVEPEFRIPLRRAPDIQQACREAYEESLANGAFVTSLRELLGIIGAHEWRKNGVTITTLDAKIYPYYGIYSPLRGEYLELIAKAPLPSNELAFDIGTGSGVIAALLAKRGVKKIVATDIEPRALVCAQDNLERLGLSTQVDLQHTDLFPQGRAPLIVCNPPWLPTRPHAMIESAIYDPDSRMLKGFLSKVGAHLEDNGEAWLIMSDLAEHLGLRSHQQLCDWIEQAGLMIVGKMDIRPQHNKVLDTQDPLHQARAAEVTSLWRLRLLKPLS